MSEDTTINELTDSGKFLYVYSDKYNIYVFFLAKKDNALYRVILNKFFYILSIEPVTIKTPGVSFENIRFFKPTRKNDEIVYTGLVTNKTSEGTTQTYKFKIERDTFVCEDPTDKVQDIYADTQFRMLTCVDGIFIESYIQKANKLYFVGKARVAEVYCDPVYGEVDISTDSIDKLYYLYSDKGNIELSSVNLDPDDFKAYVVGRIDILNKDEEVVDSIPYLESFNFFPS